MGRIYVSKRLTVIDCPISKCISTRKTRIGMPNI